MRTPDFRVDDSIGRGVAETVEDTAQDSQDELVKVGLGPDDGLPPNPGRDDGQYTFVEITWDDGFWEADETRSGARDDIEELRDEYFENCDQLAACPRDGDTPIVQ